VRGVKAEAEGRKEEVRKRKEGRRMEEGRRREAPVSRQTHLPARLRPPTQFHLHPHTQHPPLPPPPSGKAANKGRKG